MSTVPFGDPAGQHVSWISFEYLEHVVPQGAEIVNYRECKLCEKPYLADSSESDVCGREFCRAVREAWSKADAEQARLSAPARAMLT